MRRPAAFTVRLSITILGAALVSWALSTDAHWAERHLLPRYCATDLPGWILSHAVRWLGGALGVVAAWKLAPAAARKVALASGRVRAGSVVGIAVAVAASLAVTELAMRRQHRRLTLGDPPIPGGSDAPMTRADPRLGWSYYPDRTTWVAAGGRRVAYVIDGDGDRVASPGARPDPRRATVLFAGESIAFGYGLPHEETLPALVGRGLGVQTVNLAVVGYGSDQAHLRVVDALPRFERPLAVVTLFLPDQLKRNVDPWRPRLALGPGGALVPVPASTGPRIARLLAELPWHGDEAVRVTAAVLRATAEASRARGAFPLFLVTNYGAACLPDEGGEPWIVDELFVRQGLPFVRVQLDPEDRLPGVLERHPSLRGTRKLAAAVERALAERLALGAAEASPGRR